VSQLTIHVHGKPYVVGCEDGQEAHLRSLAALLNDKVAELAPDAGQLGETRLMLLGALVLADELSESLVRAEKAEAEVARLRDHLAQSDLRAVAVLEAVAAKIESMAAR
jgi:cell division protein ZapA